MNFNLKTNNLYFILFLHLIITLFLSANENIKITEILKDPIGGESDCPGGKSHEFIEFLNLGSDTFFLNDLFLSDGKKSDSITTWQDPLLWHQNCCFNRSFILPGQFAIILDKDYVQSPREYYFKIADSTVILTIDASSLVDGLTTSKGVFLYKGTRTEIKSLIALALDYGFSPSLGNADYFKLTVDLIEGFSLSPKNLLITPFSYLINPDTLSLGKYEFMQDGWICNYKCKNPGSHSEIVVCSLFVLMIGKEKSEKAIWQITKSTLSTVIESGMLVSSYYPITFALNLPKDSVFYEFTIEEKGLNASLPIDISTVWLPNYPIKINEITPRSTTEIPEWIELVNISSMPINLKDWKLGVSEDSEIITNENLILEPEEFLILTKDLKQFIKTYSVSIHVIEPLGWKSLNDYRDTLKLISPLYNEACEIVYYDSDWFDTWKKESVERISYRSNGTDKANWVLSEKASPGQPNTNILWRSVEKPDLHIGPIPFTPNNDGKDDELSIRIKLPVSYTVTIEIYGFNGIKIYECKNYKSDIFFWNGRKSNGSPAPIGPFFIVANFAQGSLKKSMRKKGILWR